MAIRAMNWGGLLGRLIVSLLRPVLRRGIGEWMRRQGGNGGRSPPPGGRRGGRWRRNRPW